jgi:hypothetical protein
MTRLALLASRLGNIRVCDVLDAMNLFGAVVLITTIDGPTDDNFVHMVTGSVLLAGLWEMFKTILAVSMLYGATRGRR